MDALSSRPSLPMLQYFMICKTQAKLLLKVHKTKFHNEIQNVLSLNPSHIRTGINNNASASSILKTAWKWKVALRSGLLCHFWSCAVFEATEPMKRKMEDSRKTSSNNSYFHVETQ